MSKETRLKIVEACVAVVGMVFIWRLVEAAIRAGVDGVYFFIGIAGIAGLGGFELRPIIESLLARRGKGNDNKKQADS